MRDFRDAKAMALTLRQALKAKSVSLTHSESLELIAKTLGFADWNVLAAKIQSERQPPAAVSKKPVPQAFHREGVPAIPLRDIVLFPHMHIPIFVARDGSRRALERALASDKRIFTITQKRANDDQPTADGLYRIGVTATVEHQLTLPNGTLKVFVQAIQRSTALRFLDGEFLAAEIGPLEERHGAGADALALSRRVLEAYQTFAHINLASPPQALWGLPHITEAGVLADTLAQFLPIAIEQRQELLETADVIERLEKILALMKTESEAA